jgi:hypothetical protein
MTEERLRTLLQAHGLGHITAALLALTAPAIGITLWPTEETALHIGASKLGGTPDLPANTPWPAWHEPMAFIGQINFAEIEPSMRLDPLPRQGLLSLFFETDGEPLYAARRAAPPDAPMVDLPTSDATLSWRVLYHRDDPTTFVRRAPPTDLPASGRFRTGAVQFSPAVTLPWSNGPEVAALGLTHADSLALMDVEPRVNGAMSHRLLGFPYTMDYPTLIACDAALRGRPDEWRQVEQQRKYELEAAAARQCCLLAQVASSEVTGMDWAGGGYLQVCIEREALRQHDISHVWVETQFI